MPTPLETITCDVVQANPNCVPCQGLHKSGSCTITSASSPTQQCTSAVFDSNCGDFTYTCTLTRNPDPPQQFAVGLVPNPQNGSTSVINLTIPIPGSTTPIPTISPCYSTCIAGGSTPAQCNLLCQPTPTVTPNFTPTPTPIQAQDIIKFPPPFSPIGNNVPLPPQIDSQRWACLKSEACSELLSLCLGLGGDNTKRAKLSGKNLLPDQDTYLLECLIDDILGPQCTTGDAAVDTSLLGTSLLANLQAAYNYNLIAIVDENNNPIAPGTPIRADNQGHIGPIEWESVTKGQRVSRVFVAMNAIDPGFYQGNDPAQKQGIFELQALPHTSCLMLTWDPEGIVFDTDTKEPVEGAEVTLFMKEDGKFRKVHANDVLGGVINPFKTKKDGRYLFRVPDGVYKMTVRADGYTSPNTISDESDYAPYTDIYDGGEIVEKGSPTHADIPLIPR